MKYKIFYKHTSIQKTDDDKYIVAFGKGLYEFASLYDCQDFIDWMRNDVHNFKFEA